MNGDETCRYSDYRGVVCGGKRSAHIAATHLFVGADGVPIALSGFTPGIQRGPRPGESSLVLSLDGIPIYGRYVLNHSGARQQLREALLAVQRDMNGSHEEEVATGVSRRLSQATVELVEKALAETKP